jgi:hypothetical protein
MAHRAILVLVSTPGIRTVRINPDLRREQRMGPVTTSDGTEIFYKDWGSGQPIVFSHGWPLSADDWDNAVSRSGLQSRPTPRGFKAR